jgi:replicative DNA helicase
MSDAATKEAEQRVLSVLLSDPEMFAECRLLYTDFYWKSHQIIFAQTQFLQNQGHMVDFITVVDRLKARGDLETAGGASYISSLVDMYFSSVGFVEHQTIMRAASARRKLTAISHGLAAAEKTHADPSAVLDSVESELFALRMAICSGEDYAPIGDGLADLDKIIRGREIENLGIKTYLLDLDNKAGLISNKSIISIAGQTGSGKTSLAYSIALRFMQKTGRSVFLWSGEMGREEIQVKLICMEGQLDSRSVIAGRMSEADEYEYLQAKDKIEKLPLFLDCTGGITIEELRSKLLRCKTKHPDMGMAIVDNMPIMTLPGDSREDGIRKAMVKIRAFIAGFGVPIIVLQQYSYQMRAKENRIPENDDIFGSSAIIQNSTHVWHVYHKKNDTDTGRAYLKLGKQRYAPTGIVPLSWNARTTTFGDYFM